MKFLCELKRLSNAINKVCLAINKRNSPIQVLDGILMECFNGILTLTGFDLNLAIIKKIEVESEIDGKVVINAQLFSEILNKLDEGIIYFSCNDKFKISISHKNTKFNLTGIDSEQFPQIFNFETNAKFKIKSLDLKNLIYQTSFAVSQNPAQNPVLSGSLFKLENDMLNLVSLDGYRVAISRKRIENLNLNFSFIVSSKTLNELYKFLSENEDDLIEIGFNEKYCSFEVSGYIILTRLLEGTFLDYEAAIPQKSSTTIYVSSKEMISRIEKVAVMVTNRISVILKINSNNVELNCESSLGDVKDIFQTQIEGDELEKIAFNFKYMLDALKHSLSDDIKIMFNDGLSPIKIVPKDGDDFLFLVLPVRI